MDDKQKLLDTFRIMMERVKNMFARKSHTHKAGDITGLSQVAVSGRYSDLSGKPSMPNIGPATTTVAGLVMPSSGLEVGQNGVLSVKVSEAAGLTITDGAVTAKCGKGMFCSGTLDSVLYVEDGNWNDIYDTLSRLVSDNGICDIRVVCRKGEESIYIDLTMERMAALAGGGAFQFVDEEIGGLVQNLGLPGVDSNEVVKYETLKLLSGDVDAVGLHLYEVMAGSGDISTVVGRIGTPVPDVIYVHEKSVSRFGAFNMTQPEFPAMLVAYMFRNGNYVPLVKTIRDIENGTPVQQQ